MAPDTLPGFAEVSILYHAGQQPVDGLWLMEEPGRHGYAISRGTLYLTSPSRERPGYLTIQKGGGGPPAPMLHPDASR